MKKTYFIAGRIPAELYKAVRDYQLKNYGLTISETLRRALAELVRSL